MGMVTCLGTGVKANWEAVTAGRSGIGPITLFDAGPFTTRIAGEVRGNFDPEGYIPPKELRRMDRYQHFALVAAGEAIKDSGIKFPPDDPWRYGVVVGSGIGGLSSIENGHNVLLRSGPRKVPPFMIPMSVINLAPGIISIKYGFKGPNFGIVNACTSGSSAIGEAYRLVREGRADLVLAGGTEAVLHRFRSEPLMPSGHCRLATMSRKRPPGLSTQTGTDLSYLKAREWWSWSPTSMLLAEELSYMAI